MKRSQVPIAEENSFRVRSTLEQIPKAPNYLAEEKSSPTPEVYSQLDGIPAHFGNAGAVYQRVIWERFSLQWRLRSAANSFSYLIG